MTLCECGEWCTLGCKSEDPTPMDEGMDFELGAACDLNDTECEACQ